MQIRPYTPEDRANLDTCDFTFTTRHVLSVRKTFSGLNTTWSLSERELEGQYTGNYALSNSDWDAIHQRQHDTQSLLLVAENGGKAVGVLDVSLDDWNSTAKIWNIYLDVNQRGKGTGTQLVARAKAFAKEHQARALVVETQTNNLDACRFYQKCGFELCGIDDHFYSNEDGVAKMGIGEVALFWYLDVQK